MDTLERIRRLREHDKRRARLDLVQAERRHQAQRDRLDAVDARVQQARADAPEGDAAELALYHAFRLRMEMVGRREQDFLNETGRIVDERRDVVVVKAREAEVVALLQEAQEEEAALEERRDEENDLAEMAVQTWARTRRKVA
ncbi:MAG: hypothetical protein GY913_23365 [Proteobacteria bacterium]|nr:hypothetical protein [Pseudomonadota bacterium]MCP4919852.1 hypothetical protein [Pseudomonadota bacterium]